MQAQADDTARKFDPASAAQISQPPIVSKIRALFEDQATCEQFLKNIKGGLRLAQIIRQLEDYTGMTKAKALGQEAFRQLGGNGKSQIQLLYHNLQQYQTQKNFKKIKAALESKSRRKVRRVLGQVFGGAVGGRRFSLVQREVEEQDCFPAGYEEVRRSGGMRFYRYAVPLTSQQTASARNVVVFGETGCGKSTFLNAVVNRLMGVDPEDKFRFQLVVEKDGEVKFSLTKDVTEYLVKDAQTNRVYRLIDTPGFGDTEGFERDEVTLGLIKAKLSSLKQIHMIVFVMKSTITRLDVHQRYVMHSLMSLFTKDYTQNITFLLTFADTGKSLAHNIIQDQEEGFGSYSDNFLIIETNNFCVFQQIDQTDSMNVLYWNQAMAAIDKFFIQVDSLNPKSLQRNKQYFQMMNKCQIEFQKYYEAIDQSIVHQGKILQYINQLIRLPDKIEQNQKYSRLKTRIVYTQVRNNYPTLRCLNCKNTNCHIICYEGYGTVHYPDPHYCQVMDQAGNCTVCPKRCHHSLHRKIPFFVQMGTQSYTDVDQQMKKRWESFISQHYKLKKNYIDTIDLLDNQFQQARKSMQIIYPILAQISKRRLYQKFEELKIEYLNHLCNILKKDQTPQSKQKIKVLKTKAIKIDVAARYLEYPLKILRPFLQNADQYYRKDPKVIRLVTDRLKSLIKTFQGINQQPEKTLGTKVQPPSLPTSRPPPPPPKNKESPNKSNIFNQSSADIMDYSPAKNHSNDNGAKKRRCRCYSCCNRCWNCILKRLCCCN